MSLKDPRHEGQLELLRWIGDGCPDGRWKGHSYKTSATALVSRRLIEVSKKGGVWSATLLQAGTYYLEHGDYPDGHWERKRRRSTGTESATDGSMRSPRPKPRPRPQPKPVAPKEPPPDLERSRQLVVELEEAGGVLERRTDDPMSYFDLATTINRYKVAPTPQEVIVSGAGERGHLRIRLVDVTTWRTETPAEVAMEERVGRWHPVVADLRSDGRLDNVSKDHQRRVMILLHCLAKEAESRGLTVEMIMSPPRSGYYAQRDTPKGLLELRTSGGSTYRVGIKQYLNRTKHVPTAQELAESKRSGWQRYPTYDDEPSERLAVLIYEGESNYSPREWGDTKRRLCAEEKLGDILAAISRSEMSAARMAEELRLAEEERTRRIERENACARAAYVEHATGKRLKQDSAKWEEADRLRRYLAAMRTRVADIADDERSAADEWIAWCERYINETVDPLGGPIRRPDVNEPSQQDIAEFRRRLGFDRRGWF